MNQFVLLQLCYDIVNVTCSQNTQRFNEMLKKFAIFIDRIVQMLEPIPAHVQFRSGAAIEQ